MPQILERLLFAALGALVRGEFLPGREFTASVGVFPDDVAFQAVVPV